MATKTKTNKAAKNTNQVRTFKASENRGGGRASDGWKSAVISDTEFFRQSNGRVALKVVFEITENGNTLYRQDSITVDKNAWPDVDAAKYRLAEIVSCAGLETVSLDKQNPAPELVGCNLDIELVTVRTQRGRRIQNIVGYAKPGEGGSTVSDGSAGDYDDLFK